MNKLMEITSV